ncbi:hypothetical protein [Anaeromyxobacter paludicola]|uniref:Uncharacterized protein n=1 Tax=Anaeromyxobacter paludicola TaxID=2918171 RepID=A0ABM7XAQ6_9BACT|nr:hypothetical protein [Anaeromyxobacter paludicola]BDG08943.1 hypothetical protein AMPC_20560 [Anaeromyxobacter paludicola]
MAQALTRPHPDRRLAALAAAFLPAPRAALSRLTPAAASPVREEAERLASAGRGHTLLALRRAFAPPAPPAAATVEAAAGRERGGLAALLGRAAHSAPGAAAHPLARLCRDHLSSDRSLP